MNHAKPVSPKVVAAAAGAGAGATVAAFLIWLLGAWLWSAGWAADQVDNALAAVPWPVSGLVLLVITVAGAAVPGYQTVDPARNVAREASPEYREGALGLPEGVHPPATHSIHQVDRNRTDDTPERALDE